jgi:hypothetical protein
MLENSPPDSIELRVRRNAPRVGLYLLAFAAAAEVSRRLLALLADHFVVRWGIGLAHGVRNFFLIMAIWIGVVWGTAVLTSALNRRFPGVTRRTSTVIFAAVLCLIVIACFFFLPFCLGSLKDGTYDCITLAHRARSALAGS